VTTLPSGLRVASQPSFEKVACLGLFVDAGTVHEDEHTLGMTDLAERMFIQVRCGMRTRIFARFFSFSRFISRANDTLCAHVHACAR
jgi:hypothetical protein